MKKTSAVLLCAFFAFFGCNSIDTPGNSERGYDLMQQAETLTDYLKKSEEPSQFFTVSSSKPTQVKGKNGTIISIDPANLETVDGKPLGPDIRVELKELTDQGDLMRTNVQTMSNGRLLVSGGAYYINMTSNGQQLKLKESKSLPVTFPKLTDKEMALFYGRRDSLGQINWQPTNERFASVIPREKKTTDSKKEIAAESKSEMESIFDHVDSPEKAATPEQKKEWARSERNRKVFDRFYAAINLDSFGWINCDRFLEIEERTSLLVMINPRDSVIAAHVYLIFKDINSIMGQGYFKGSDSRATVSFKGVPIGYKARAIAITIKDEKPYVFASDFTIAKDGEIETNFKPITEKEFKSFIRQ